MKLLGWAAYLAMGGYAIILSLGGVVAWKNPPLLACLVVLSCVGMQQWEYDYEKAKRKSAFESLQRTVQRGLDTVSHQLFDAKKGGWPW